MIDAKTADLAKPVHRIGAGPGLARIIAQDKAIAAFYDTLIRPDGKLDADVEKLISRPSVGVLNLGAETAEIVVVAETVLPVYGKISVLRTSACYHCSTRWASASSRNSSSTGIRRYYIEAACRTKKFEVFGEERGVCATVRLRVPSTYPRSRASFFQRLGMALTRCDPLCR